MLCLPSAGVRVCVSVIYVYMYKTKCGMYGDVERITFELFLHLSCEGYPF